MKIVLQRVSKAQVIVAGKEIGAIVQGLVILLCVEQGDTEQDCQFLAQKCSQLRIFADQQGKMNLSCLDVKGSILLISQFTLAADWRQGRRPSFIKAADATYGEKLYKIFANELQATGIPVACGVFGAHMEVSLTNDGPVTLILDSQR